MGLTEGLFLITGAVIGTMIASLIIILSTLKTKSTVENTPIKRLIRFLFTFKGRINRKRFWGYIGLSTLIYIVLAILAMLLEMVMTGASEPGTDPGIFYLIIMAPITIVKFFYIDHALLAKRWHDIDKSAWNILWLYIPIIGIVPGLIVGFSKGNPEPNKYGNPPK